MRNKFKRKKKIKLNKLIYILLFFFLIILIRTYMFKINNLTNNSKFIINLLENSNMYNKNIINKINTYFTNNVLNKPINILKNNLNYKTTAVNLVDLKYNEVEKVKIYIYNSHQGETYNQKYLEAHNIIPNVLMASLMFKEKLDNINLKTVVEESDILEYMRKNNLNHAGSYIASRVFLENAINNYSSAKLYIDIHRDAANYDVTYTNINGKDCAKILFVIGLENPNYENNLKVANDINNILKSKYPSLTRGIMKKQGYGVDGIYNQDLNGNVILLELGGNQNNIDEINNTLDLLTEVFGEYLNEKE